AVEEEGITTPASKEAIIAGLYHLRVPSHRDGRSCDDDPPAVPRPGGLVAIQETQGCGLRPILQRREAHLVSNIGESITVGVDLDFIKCLGRERLVGSRSRRVHTAGRVYVHDEDRLLGISRFGESKQISEVETSVSAGERDVGTGIMV